MFSLVEDFFHSCACFFVLSPFCLDILATVHEGHSHAGHSHEGVDAHSYIGPMLCLGFVFMLLIDQLGGGNGHSHGGSASHTAGMVRMECACRHCRLQVWSEWSVHADTVDFRCDQNGVCMQTL